ncbi:heme peroxidase, partial [Linderina pennispora]
MSALRIANRSFVRAAPKFTAARTATPALVFARGYSNSSRTKYEMPRTNKSAVNVGIIGALAAGALAGWYFYSSELTTAEADWKKVNYYNVYKDIADLLEDEDYDDGSYGPVFVRLAWHASGTYSKKDRTGGSTGGTIRFHPEANYGANAGLHFARERLEPLKKKYPHISYADLYTLAGVVAVQELGGPVVPWRPGRPDAVTATAVAATPDGRLPDAAQGADHVRDIFYRMGFNDQEI